MYACFHFQIYGCIYFIHESFFFSRFFYFPANFFLTQFHNKDK